MHYRALFSQTIKKTIHHKLILFSAMAAFFSSACIQQTTQALPKTGGGGAARCSVSSFTGGIDPGSATSSTTASISWIPLTGCNLIYRIYKLPDLTTLNTFAAGTASAVSVSSLTPGASYQFVVRAYDGVTEDQNLNIVNITMPAPTIGTFTISSVTSSTNHKPTISWSAAANAETYTLQLSYDPAFSAASTVLTQTGIVGTSYTPSSDLDMGKYWIKVSAQATGATSVNASNNGLINFAVYPIFTGCLQGYYASTALFDINNVSVNLGWQTTCTRSAGLENGYFLFPGGITLDNSTGYMYINDNYVIDRWDINSFTPQGFMSYANNTLWETTSINYPYGGQYIRSSHRPGLYYSYNGCSDGTYVYLPSAYKVMRIRLSDQTYQGHIGNGVDGWNNTATVSGGGGYRYFGTAVGTACNSTDSYVYVADMSNHRIARWNKNGNAAGHWGFGAGAAWSVGACCTPPSTTPNVTNSIYYPMGIFLSSTGVLYFGDYLYRISRMTDLINPVIHSWLCSTQVAGSYWHTTPYGAGCPVPSWNGGYNMALSGDSLGYLYTVEHTNGTLAKIKMSDGSVVGYVQSGLYAYNDKRKFVAAGIAVRSDGSMIFVSDLYAARVMVFDGSLNYLGYLGAGYNGLAPTTAPRPPISGPTSTGFQALAVDNANDSIYVPGYTNLGGSGRYMIERVSMSTGAPLGSTETVTAGIPSGSGAGLNPAQLGNSYIKAFAVSKVNNYLYAHSSSLAMITRWDRSTFAFGGWIGFNQVGWQTGLTMGGGSTNNCYFNNILDIVTDKNGYLYVYDDSNRVIVWDEVNGVCLGSFGGGATTLQANLVGQADSYGKARFFTASAGPNLYQMNLSILGDYLYVGDQLYQYVVQRYLLGSTPSSTTYDSYMGGNTPGWLTAAFAGPLNTVTGSVYGFYASTPPIDQWGPLKVFGGGVMIWYSQGNFYNFRSIGDSALMGELFRTNTDYSFSTAGAPVAGFQAPCYIGNGHIMGKASTFNMAHQHGIDYDPVGKNLYFNISSNYGSIVEGGVMLRYHQYV